MAVFTEVSFEEADALLHQLGLGVLEAMSGCTGGIENTNYFVSTQHHGLRHDYVLTLFERLGFLQLPFYLRLMQHLAHKGIPVPEPHANASGHLVFELKGKPACVVNRLRGKNELDPSPLHCTQVGSMLAKMHLAGQDFLQHQPNLRGLAWWNSTVPTVLPYLDDSQSRLIQTELAYQNQVAAQIEDAKLPSGPIHADLFRDNVMFDTVDEQPVLGGFFDFYFAGIDTWVFDLAVALNDWCIDLATGEHHAKRAHYFIAGYETVRSLSSAERTLLPALLRAGALRFWISRLWDFHMPREASMLKAHDPSHFERILRHRVDDTTSYPTLFVIP
jgi:homoserine kinase type II